MLKPELCSGRELVLVVTGFVPSAPLVLGPLWPLINTATSTVVAALTANISMNGKSDEMLTPDLKS